MCIQVNVSARQGSVELYVWLCFFSAAGPMGVISDACCVVFRSPLASQSRLCVQHAGWCLCVCSANMKISKPASLCWLFYVQCKCCSPYSESVLFAYLHRTVVQSFFETVTSLLFVLNWSYENPIETRCWSFLVSELLHSWCVCLCVVLHQWAFSICLPSRRPSIILTLASQPS